MGKFEYVFVPDREYTSQLDADMDVLSAMVVEVCDYYENIFAGLDAVIKAVNDSIK